MQKKSNKIYTKKIFDDYSLIYSASCNVNLQDKDFTYKNNVFLRQGGFTSYGSCFLNSGTKVVDVEEQVNLKRK